MQDNYSKEISIIEITNEKDKRLISECIDVMEQVIILYSKKYGRKGIEKALEENGRIAQEIFNLILLQPETEKVIRGIPTFDKIVTYPSITGNKIKISEIVGKFSTYTSKTYIGSVVLAEDMKSGYEKIYFLFKSEK